MCLPAKSNIKPVKSTTAVSCAKIVGLLVVGFGILAPVIISEAIGGWTRKYTSRVQVEMGDLNGKVAIVTGANTGIGYYTALELARHGARVVATSRSPSRGQAALQSIREALAFDESKSTNVQFLSLDLASFKSIERFANDFEALKLPLHTLVLNAGVMKSPGAEFVGQSMQYGFETTKEGFEQHIGVNHVGHAYLTKLLLNSLKESSPSRVVSVSSLAEQNAYKEGLRFDEWRPRDGRMPIEYEDGGAYGQSKLANLMYTKELARRFNNTGISFYSLHPGVIQTDLLRYMEPVIQEQQNAAPAWLRPMQFLLTTLFQSSMMSAKDGALTQLFLATASSNILINGGFYHPVGTLVNPQHAQGNNEELQKKLWDETEAAMTQGKQYRVS